MRRAELRANPLRDIQIRIPKAACEQVIVIRDPDLDTRFWSGVDKFLVDGVASLGAPCPRNADAGRNQQRDPFVLPQLQRNAGDTD